MTPLITDSGMNTRRCFHYLSILTLTAMLAACGTAPAPQKIPEPEIPKDSLTILLEKARTAAPVQAQFYRLEAAQILADQSRWQLVEELLTSMDPRLLSDDGYARYCILYSHVHLSDGDTESAFGWLQSPRLIEISYRLDPALKIELIDAKAQTLALSGRHIASALERIALSELIEEPERLAQNNRGIWQSLSLVSRDALLNYQKTAVIPVYQAWLELAAISKDNALDLEYQLASIDDWRRRWPQHPAARQLPGGLELLQSLAENRPRKLAVMLPFSGKLAPFGRAIRDGFVFAYYRAKSGGGFTPELEFFDSAQLNPTELYTVAREAGADMIVGPFDKQTVATMISGQTNTLPTLALNYIDDDRPLPQRFYQLGLNARDEAHQIAEQARLATHERATLIYSNSSWGQRIAGEFRQQWERLEGEIASEAVYEPTSNYSEVVQQALGIDASVERHKTLQSYIGGGFKFEPRRRKDIDMILMLARPQQARLISPLFAFHYAGEIPVYSTSLIYSGVKDSAKDSDLNGIKFSEIPWMFDPIQESTPRQGANKRLFALGIDAFQLHARLPQLEFSSSNKIYGVTGALALNRQGQIVRQLSWAQMRDGSAVPIPLLAANEY